MWIRYILASQLHHLMSSHRLLHIGQYLPVVNRLRVSYPICWVNAPFLERTGSAMNLDQRSLRVLSVYEGFFAGGARALHSSVIGDLHTMGGQTHSVLAIHREMRRERMRQPMGKDARYLALRRAGVRISSLGRTSTLTRGFTEREVAKAARRIVEADVVLSLKEQPLRLLNHPELSLRPMVVCLHRSDPQNQGPDLEELRLAVGSGRVAGVVCCAESTRAAYAAVGVPAGLLTVIENGVDLARFRPPTTASRRGCRSGLGISDEARLVVFAARYDGMKNVPLLLASAREFLRADPAGEVILCGAGMTRQNPGLLADIATAMGQDADLLTRLHCLGLRDDMPTVYAAADVVTLTSSTGEAAPLSLIEGMMCGAIPVATDVGDCSSIVDGHGLIAPPDAQAISAAWSEAIDRRAEWKAALARSRPRFSLVRMTSSYSRLIKQAAAGAASAVAAASRGAAAVPAARSQ
jgi:glycosyltransferase involved in cell wall biosynthesis